MEETTELIDQGVQQRSNSPMQKEKLPNSSGVLTLGILSIVFAGGVGIILGIISLSLSGSAIRTYQANPDRYTESSYKNTKAGKVCAIIGVSIAGFVILILMGAIIANA